MSDPVKSSEIEDVLSSIRRLVSEEARSAPEEVFAAEAPADDVPSDALVLTPALRIHEGGKDESDAAEELQVDEAAEEQSSEDLSDVVWEAVADIVVEEIADVTLGDAEGDIAALEETSGSDENADATPEDDNDTPEEAAVKSAGETLESKIAALETLIGHRDDSWEPEEGDESLTAETPAGTTAAEAIEWEDSQPEAVEDTDWEEAESTPFEPASSEVEEPVAVDFEEVVEPDAVEEDAAQSNDAAPAGTDAPEREAFDDDATTIDEDALRDVVIEIVRQELQGQLGERITRNVRRLVRREIHRALASQELD